MTCSAWVTPWWASPHTGVIMALVRSSTGSQPSADRSHHSGRQAPPQPLDGGPDGAVGGHRAPGDPTATVEVVAEQAGVALDAAVDGDREDAGAGAEQQAVVGRVAAVEAGDGDPLDDGHRARHEVDALGRARSGSPAR